MGCGSDQPEDGGQERQDQPGRSVKAEGERGFHSGVLPSVSKGSHQLDHFLLPRALLLSAALGAEKADRDTRGLGVRDKPSATAVSVAAVP